MDEKEKLIAEFEACYWLIDDQVRQAMLRLPINHLKTKLIEWQNWAEIGGKVVFKR